MVVRKLAQSFSLALLTLLIFAASSDPFDLRIRLHPPENLRQSLKERVHLRGALVNFSDNPTFAIRPGDGSESGWREPYIHYSAERWDGKSWNKVEPRPIGRCGLYAPGWSQDVVRLHKGDTLELGDWLPDLNSCFELSEGRYRFRLHYRYSRGLHKDYRSGLPIPESLGKVPAFHLISDPQEIVFTR